MSKKVANGSSCLMTADSSHFTLFKSLLHSLTLIESQSYPIGSLDQSLSARNVFLYFC